MEIGEVLSKVLNRERRLGRFEQEAMNKVYDIKSANPLVITHTSDISKRVSILSTSLISEKHEDNWFHVGPKLHGNPRIWDCFGVIIRPTGEIYHETGIKLERPLTADDKFYVYVKRKIAPQEFIGLLLSEEQRYFNENVKLLTRSMRKAGLPLPIYDSSGNLLWPKRMTHEEIVRMVGESGKERSV